MSDSTVGALRSPHHGWLRLAVAQAARTVRAMHQARTTRRMLADMDDRLLADIGVGRGDALQEARRPMWDLAASRR